MQVVHRPASYVLDASRQDYKEQISWLRGETLKCHVASQTFVYVVHVICRFFENRIRYKLSAHTRAQKFAGRRESLRSVRTTSMIWVSENVSFNHAIAS
jgi:hypothetical protein